MRAFPAFCSFPFSLQRFLMVVPLLVVLGGCAGKGGGKAQDPPTATVSLTPASIAMPGELTQSFQATVTGLANQAVRWSILEGAAGGSISDTGSYTAPEAAGDFHVRATAAADPTRFATAAVQVKGRIVVTLTPINIALITGGTTTFTATVANATNPALSWSATGGTITNAGLYTAPATPGSYEVQAASVQNPKRFATATVTVSPAPQAPVITAFNGAPAAITAGQSSTLSWTVSGAVSLSISQGVGTVTGSSRVVTPAATTTYTLTASNATGTATATATVTVSPAPSAPVIASFSATPAAITVGQGSTLAWSVSGATTLAISPAPGTVTGIFVAVSPAATTLYTLTASNATGTVTATVTVTVSPAPQAPVIGSFTATPIAIAAGQSSALAWTVTGAGSLSISPTVGAVTGTSIGVTPAATTTYTLTASNATGSSSATATVTVVPPGALPVITAFTASPATLTAGASSTLGWTVSGATLLSIAPAPGVVTGASLSVSPASTTSYTLTASNATGPVTATITVTVNPPPIPSTPNPILFVTQVPFDGFATISMPFGNHSGMINSVPRGGDLWIRYPNGSLRNLTQEAGFGMTGLQGANSIAVREPAMHWSGTKAVFAMVVGTATLQYQWEDRFWQLYEITGLGSGQAALITKVAGQPAGVNNISPVYGSDDRIIFASDRSRTGEPHLYPQLDEYESTITLTGLWSMAPGGGDLKLLNHAPSGAFHPFVDSFGRVVFSKWDHLQRDQQADADAGGGSNGSFNYADETLAAARLNSRTEIFPEPRTASDPENVANKANGHRFNQFFPWQLNEDGTTEETLNHVGRHEIGGFYLGDPSFTDDPNLSEYAPENLHSNRNYITGDGGLFGLREDPLQPGLFYATNMREFNGGRAGQIITITGAPTTNPSAMNVTWITDPVTRNEVQPGQPIPAGATGRYRNPLPMSDGSLVAAHTPEVMADSNLGSRANPNYRYHFRLKTLKKSGAFYVADQPLTPGISKAVSWFDPDVLVTYNGPLWEVDPVEVVARPRPTKRTDPLGTPEQQVFQEVGVEEAQLRTWLTANNLALIISRDVTTRDEADVQQPFNLRVPGGVSAVAKPGKVYDLAHLQIFQGDQVRGYGGTAAPRPGRRVLAQTMKGVAVAKNPANPGGPVGSVKVAADGSTAAFVPALKALTWQLTDGAGKAVIRERNWISFQPGEIRTCVSCHGLNQRSQMGLPPPQNKPEALRQLLTAWKTQP